MVKKTDENGNITIVMTPREAEVLKNIVALYFDPRGRSPSTHDSVIERRHLVGQEFLRTV